RDKEGLAFCIPVDDLQKGLKEIDKQTEEQKKKRTARYNSQSIFRRVALAGNLHARGTQFIEQQWLGFLKKFGNINVAELLAIKKAWQDQVQKEKLTFLYKMDDISEALIRLGEDELVPEGTKQKLAELWSAHNALRDYCQNPGKSYDEFRKMCAKYR